MPEAKPFDELVERFISERLTPEELPQFLSFLEEEGPRLSYAKRIDLDFLSDAWIGWSSENQAAKIYDRILQSGNIPVLKTLPVYDGTAHRFHFIKKAWFRYAAVILIMISGYAVYQYTLTRSSNDKKVSQKQPLPVVPDIAPGGNKAILILADNSVLSLDSLKAGSSVLQGGMKIIKLANGEIRYVPVGGHNPDSGTVLRNTVKTPRGGQQQITLPDGTQVWLNTESAITYPASFTGSQRIVSISGEVYFDVAKNKEKPFIVNINDYNKVEALGTQFNINSYTDETNIRTTLLEGKVRVTHADASVTLYPGQQLAGSRLNNTADLVQVMAWKNGVFTFEDKSLQQILRELARWYDLTIVYEKNIPDTRLRGEMGMNLNLSQVIKGLEAMEVNCRLEEGRKLVVF